MLQGRISLFSRRAKRDGMGAMTAIDAGRNQDGQSAGLFRDLALGRTFRGRRYLISPAADFFCAGGGALVFLGLLFLFIPAQGAGVSRDAVVNTAAVFAFLSYFVNYPHFMASYELLYGSLWQRMGQFTKRDFIWWRYVNAAFIVPAALILFFAWALWSQNFSALGWSVHAMFFFVGWHYVKQSYGVFVVLSGMKGVYYSQKEVWLIKAHVYSIWLYSWYASGSVVHWSDPVRSSNFWGVNYPPIPLYRQPWTLNLFFWICVALAIGALAAILWNWRRTGKRPSLTGLVGFTSLYTLLAFVRIHPLFTYAAPMFHSLQYMLFVAAYKRGEWKLEGEEEHAQRAAMQGGRKPWMRALTYFFLIAATGALAFDVLPQYFAMKGPRWGLVVPAIFMFHVFINTHHYFIDNVIWRRGNKEVGRYLAAK